jgi:hypothetical protein
MPDEVPTRHWYFDPDNDYVSFSSSASVPCTNIHVEWGETAAYGNVTNSWSGQGFSVVITSYKPPVGVYHYRARGTLASFPNTEFYGDDSIFIVPDVATLPASDIGPTSARLRGEVIFNYGIESTYYLFGWPTGENDIYYTGLVTSGEFSQVVTALYTGALPPAGEPLTPLTTYTYRAQLRVILPGIAGGTGIADGAIVEFTTTARKRGFVQII